MSIQGEFVGLLLGFVLVRGTGAWGLEWLYVGHVMPRLTVLNDWQTQMHKWQTIQTARDGFSESDSYLLRPRTLIF